MVWVFEPLFDWLASVWLTDAATLIWVPVRSRIPFTDPDKVTTAPLPSNLNAWPTNPCGKVTFPVTTPLLLPVLSFALPSPCHQPTASVGSGVQVKTPVLALIVAPTGA